MITIKRGAATVATVNPLSSSNMTKAVMGDEQITLVWEAPAFVSYYLGDYITFEGANWTLNKLPTVKKLSSKTWQYNAVFQSTKYELIKAMYLLFDNTDTLPSGEFPLTGTANTFMELLVANLNRVAGSAVWTVGQVIENTDYKNLTFSNEDCLSVLARLASEFDTEYHVHNHIIHLKKISTEREITLQYGSTLYDIERSSVDSSDVVTRLYPFGSTKNLASNYRGGNSPLRLPVANGNYIESNVNLYGIIEQSKTFDDIYPRLYSGGAGVVTGVGNYLEFTDSALDFNINDYLLDGTKAKIRFNTGECAGYDFEIASYNHATKTFVLIPNTQENDFTLPTDDLKPAVSDKYVLIDIVMPPAYLAAAEAELLTRAQEYMSQNSTPKVAYKTTFSAIYAKLNLQNVECGDSVTVYDADMGINEQIRIVKLTKGLTESGGSQSLTIDLSNTVTATRLQRIEGNLAAVENNVIVTNQRVNQNNLRAYQWTKELQGMVFDPDGYFDPQNIKPLSIETTMVSVSAKSQIFQLSSLLQPNYAGNPQVMQWSAGLLTHFTIADNAITEWIISQGSITITGENQTKPLYIYARCLRSGSTGDIYLAPVALKFNEGSTYYYFLIGVLHTPISAVRGISLNYGQSTINGQFITTGVISSIDGATYFNLNTGEIGGNIKFRSTSGALKTVEQAIDEVEVGGRNLIQDSQGVFTGESTIYNFKNWIIGDNLGGKTITFSLKARTKSLGTDTRVLIAIHDATWVAWAQDLTSESNNTTWQYIKKTVVVPESFNGTINVGLYNYPPENNGTVEAKEVKVEFGNKATGWSPAPEDTEAAISSINSKLSDISNDNKLTPDEKPAVKKEWDAIAGEYQRLIAQADSMSVSRTVYEGIYSTLSAYLSPLIANLATTSDIVGSTFRNNFTNYYNARTDLQNALMSIEIGGRNMLALMNFENGFVDFITGMPAGSGYATHLHNISPILINTTKTAICNYLGDLLVVNVYSFSASNEYLGRITLTKNKAFNFPQNAVYFNVEIYGGGSAITKQLIIDNLIHLKFGNKATDWSPAPEDIDAKIDNLKPAGKNYLINSRTDSLVGWGAYGGTMSVDTDEQYGKVVEYSRPDGGGFFMRVFSIDTSELKNTELVYYCIAKPISGTTIFNFGGWNETFTMLNNNSPYRDLGNGWRMYYKVFTAGGAIASGVTFGLNSVGGTWRFHSFGVAKGNTPPSDWDASPKESDFLKEIFENANEETGGDINGGSWMTNLLRMRGTDGVVRGGLSGLAGDNIGMWTGGTYQQALDSHAKIILRKDGSGQLAGGNITWDEEGALELLGKITAGSGKIGGLDIFSNSLKSASMSFSETPVESIASLITPATVSLAFNSTQNASASNTTAIAYTNNFAIPWDAKIKFRATTGWGVSWPTAEKGKWTVLVKQVGGSTVFSQTGNDAIGNQLFEVSVPAGTYVIEVQSKSVSPIPIGESNTASASITGESSSTIYAYGYNFQTKIGNNGFYSFWDALKFLYYNPDTGLSVRGATDIPAGLGGASINSGGTILAHWGKITGNGQNPGQVYKNGSNYTIYHYLGNTDYSLILTPISANVPYFSSKSANTVVVTCAGGFDFVLIRTK